MKVFASDFDGTIHFVDEKIGGYFKQGDLRAIKKFQENGNLFGLCTGRPLYGFEGDDIGGPECDFIIASTGGIISRKENGLLKVLQEDTITTEQVGKIQELCDGRGILYIHADGHVFTLFERRPGYDSQVVLEHLEDLNGKHVTAISVWTPTLEMAETLTYEINKKFPEEMDAYQNVNWLDAVHHGVSKGSGIKQAKKIFKADMISGIGDSFNDIPSLDAADVAFTFHRCDERVKQHADYIVDSVEQAIAIFEKL